MLAARVSIVLAVVLVFPAFGQPYEAVVAGLPVGCAMTPIAGPGIEFIPHGSSPTVGATSVAAAPGGRIFATLYRGPSSGELRGVQVLEIRPGGTSEPVSELVPGWESHHLVVDRAGRTYVLARKCAGACTHYGEDAIFTFDANGNAGPVHLIGVGFSYAFFSAAMDLAADQCTMFLIQDGSAIRRFNVCTGSFLPDFAPIVPPDEFTTLRVLPDGGLLVGHTTKTVRYAADGTIAQTYPVKGRGAIGLLDGGGRAWIAQQCDFRWIELDLATGNVTQLGGISTGIPMALVPYDGWSAVLGSFHSPNVPAASMIGLILLGALLSSIAWLRLW